MGESLDIMIRFMVSRLVVLGSDCLVIFTFVVQKSRGGHRGMFHGGGNGKW